jgi:hypothetical protein
MQQFIEKQHAGTVGSRAAPAKHRCDMYAKKPEYRVTNADLGKLAHKTETNKNNNNVFNGKNISDHSKVSNFYALKGRTAMQQSPLLYFG